MKLTGIEVGKYYSDSYERRVLILEVGVYGKVYPDSRWVHSVESERKDYVRVETAYKREELFHCRSIKHDWETQEKIEKEKEEEASHGIARVNYLWDVLEKHTHLKRRYHYPETRIELNHKEVEEVCKVLLDMGNL